MASDMPVAAKRTVHGFLRMKTSALTSSEMLVAEETTWRFAKA
jgi:hypothetical protein